MISLSEFVQSYNSDEFRKWFSYIESVLFRNSIPRLDRLHILSLYLYSFLDPSIENEEDIILAFDQLSRNINPHIYRKVRRDLEDIYELTGSDLVKKLDKTSLTGLVGASVYTKDANKIGNIEGVRSFIVVRGGVFYIHRYYIPVGSIDRCKDKKRHLKITKDRDRKNYIIEPDRHFYYTNDARIYYLHYLNPSFARSFPPVPVKNQADTDGMREPSPEYHCELCKKQFGTEDKLDNHVKIQHVNPMDLNEKNLNALV